MSWKKFLRYDPIPALLESDNEAIVFWTQKDLLGKMGDLLELKNSKQAQKIIGKQLADGSWKNPSKKVM